MTSAIESFQSQMQSVLTNVVITPLVAWLHSEKKVDVSVEEILDALKIPRLTKPLNVTPPSSSQPPIPLSFGTASVSVTPTVRVARPKSKGQTTLDNYNGPTCKYVFKRGEQKGQTCGKPSTNGSEFCDQCNNKKSSSKSSETSTKPTKAEAKSVAPSIGFTAPVGKRAEKLKVELREAGPPGTYIDTQTNIVVKKVTEKDKTVYVAVGVQEESGFRTLTEEEKTEALNRSFSLQNVTTTNAEPKAAEPKAADTKATDTKAAEPKKIVAKQPVTGIPDIESDQE
jgi:hypothetical protein